MHRSSHIAPGIEFQLSEVMDNGLCYCLAQQRSADALSLHARIDVEAEQLGDRSLHALDCKAADQFAIYLCHQFDFVRGLVVAKRTNGSIQGVKIGDQTERSQ